MLHVRDKSSARRTSATDHAFSSLVFLRPYRTIQAYISPLPSFAGVATSATAVRARPTAVKVRPEAAAHQLPPIGVSYGCSLWETAEASCVVLCARPCLRKTTATISKNSRRVRRRRLVAPQFCVTVFLSFLLAHLLDQNTRRKCERNVEHPFRACGM